jgi:hypothetical protein
MKEAIDRTLPCPTTIEAWLMKYTGRSNAEIDSMNGTFEDHCAARTVLALKNAGAVFPNVSDKSFKVFKDAFAEQPMEMIDGNDTRTDSRRRQRQATAKP